LALPALLAGTQQLPLFIGAGLLLNITPGVDMALLVRCSAAQGFKACSWSTAPWSAC
jgi:threonine/homoserine/homoserine lactone efflux protein